VNQLIGIHNRVANGKGALMRRSTRLTLAVVCLLIAVKTIAWQMTSSLSLLSSLVDSGMDFLASLLNFLAISYALLPPDHEHRFGHGKVEYIAGLAQAAFISGTAIFVGLQAIGRFIEPQPLENSDIGLGVMVFSMLATFTLVCYQRKVARETDSTAVMADVTHYAMDMLSNLAVIVAIGLATGFGWYWADPFFALAIAAYILYGAWEVGYKAFQNLMDREFSDEERGRIYEIARGLPGVKGARNLRTRRSGVLAFIQMTIDVEGALSLKEAHDINDQVEQAIEALHPDAQVHIHTEPV
jgi:ferrous-iron efflux pump FieF